MNKQAITLWQEEKASKAYNWIEMQSIDIILEISVPKSLQTYKNTLMSFSNFLLLPAPY